MINVTIPYTYLIKHITSGNLYHGSRTAKGCNPDELLKEDGYVTSSKIVKEIIRKEGINSFEVISIEVFENKESARIAEELYHKEFDVRSNICYLNQWNSGNKWYCDEHTEETKAKISASLVGVMAGDKHPLYGKKHSEETKEKFKYRKYSSGENHYMYGKKRSEESKKKTSETLKGMFVGEKSCWFGKTGEETPNYGKKHSEETKIKISKANTGRKHTEEEKAKMRESQKNVYKIKCNFCEKEGRVHYIKKYHLDNCKLNPVNKLHVRECPHCGIQSDKGYMNRWHFDNCKNAPDEIRISQSSKCPHCDKEGGISIMKRWHFDNCKHKLNEAA